MRVALRGVKPCPILSYLYRCILHLLFALGLRWAGWRFARTLIAFHTLAAASSRTTYSHLSRESIERPKGVERLKLLIKLVVRRVIDFSTIHRMRLACDTGARRMRNDNSSSATYRD
jgi:hypothetical protein